MAMETYSTQVMELLSLGKSSDGHYYLTIVVAHEDRQATYIIDIDEFTYLGLEALRPLDGGRARLSPYPKWDPYRNTHYSAIVRTTGVFRDTLYFACSESFVDRINRIRQGELPLVLMNEEDRIGEAETAVRRRAPFLRQLRAQLSGLANLLPAAFILLAVLSIPSEGKANSAHAQNVSFGVAEAAEAKTDREATADAAADILAEPTEATAAPGSVREAPKEQASLAVVQPARPIGQPQVQTAAQKAGYEIIDIDEEKKFFGLSKDYVALTFDDGPSALTQDIVDILTEHKIAATFLFVGKNVKRHPEAVAYASEHGMSIGNHSWDHSVLTKAQPKQQSANLLKTSAAIEALTDTPVTLFRPPYGAVNDELVATADALNMKTLLWNRDPEDWNAKKPEDIVRYFHEVDAAGGVYVLHEDKNTVAALPEIIEYLQGKKLTFAAFK